MTGIGTRHLMRAVIFLLMLLAALKIGANEYFYRTATTDVIVNAYRERAILACQSDPKAQILVSSPLAWTNPTAVKVVIGKSNLDVHFWQVGQETWNARYRNPYLHLVVGERPSVYCEYDIVNGAASVFRM
jgi:hypothetical protein